MNWRYALFLGSIAGLAAAVWLERDTVGALVRAAPQLAQDLAGRLPGGDGAPPAPGAIPHPGPMQTGPSAIPANTSLDVLFMALRRSETPEEAARIEADIYLRLSQARSPTVNLMMNSAAVMAERGDDTGARPIYRKVTELEPDYAEGWARAAGSAFAAGEMDEAEMLLRRALRIEPRHYAAWAGLGAVLEAEGDLAGARDAYREALFYNPFQDGARRGLLRVETQLEGLAL